MQLENGFHWSRNPRNMDNFRRYPDGVVEIDEEREVFALPGDDPGPTGVQGEPGVPENTVLVEDEKSLDGEGIM